MTTLAEIQAERARRQSAPQIPILDAVKAEIARRTSAQAPQPQREVVATTADGGEIYKMENGGLGFTSPKFSTTDPAAIEKLMDGATGADVTQSGFRQTAIDENPVAARGAVAVRGVPFVGEYMDEAVGATFGETARDSMRFTQNAMDQERPKESMGYGLAGGILGSIPAVVAGGPAVAANAARTAFGRTAQGAVLGSVLGGIEGAISGFGRGTGQDRAGEAGKGAAIGAGVGGVVGAAAPAIGKFAAWATENIKGRDVSAVASALGISKDAARVVRAAIENDDFAAAEAALRRAGPDGMLADAGPASRQLLDTSITGGGRAGRVAGSAVQERAAQAGRNMDATLDRVLGPVEGQNAITRNIREGTANARRTTYDAAYAREINYAKGGRALESLGARVPQSAINKANDLMRLEGVESAQIIARIGDNGRVTYETLPDVRQWDYITRALNEVADNADGAGKLGGTTQTGGATRNLAKSIRSVLRREVPEYGVALDTAADAISRRNAQDLGASMLRANTTREMVRDGLKGASRAEREAAKQGLRSQIDETLAQIGRVASDPNVDARELQRLVGPLTSRAGKDKLTSLLGARDAQTLFDEMDAAIVTLELRGAIARNSATAVRTATMGQAKDITSPGAFGILKQGEPIQATKRLVQVFTGNTPEARQLREMGIFDEIAEALTTMRGGQAQRALKIVERAMDGRPVTEAQARLVGQAVTSSSAAVGYQSGSQALTTR